MLAKLNITHDRLTLKLVHETERCNVSISRTGVRVSLDRSVDPDVGKLVMDYMKHSKQTHETTLETLQTLALASTNWNDFLTRILETN